MENEGAISLGWAAIGLIAGALFLHYAGPTIIQGAAELTYSARQCVVAHSSKAEEIVICRWP